MAASPGKTAIQFGLRAILGSMTAFAVFFAAVAPALRVWSASERQAFLVVWATAFLTSIGFLVVICFLRLRSERRAGPICFVLPQPNHRRRYVGAALLCLLLVGLLAATALLQQRQAHQFAEMKKRGGTIRFSLLSPISMGISFGMPLAMLSTALWWRKFRVELCEHGVIHFVSFVPWSSIHYEFEDRSARLTLHIALNRSVERLYAVVPPELLEPVRDMLQRLKPAP
jgi:hypothetical protein